MTLAQNHTCNLVTTKIKRNVRTFQDGYLQTLGLDSVGLKVEMESFSTFELIFLLKMFSTRDREEEVSFKDTAEQNDN